MRLLEPLAMSYAKLEDNAFYTARNLTDSDFLSGDLPMPTLNLDAIDDVFGDDCIEVKVEDICNEIQDIMKAQLENYNMPKGAIVGYGYSMLIDADEENIIAVHMAISVDVKPEVKGYGGIFESVPVILCNDEEYRKVIKAVNFFRKR